MLPISKPTFNGIKNQARMQADREFLSQVTLHKQSPHTIAMMQLTGGSVKDVDRFIPVPEFTCWNCKYVCRNQLCIGYPMNVKWILLPNKIDYEWKWLIRGMFCSLGCAFCFAKHRWWMFPRRTLSMAKLMAIVAYGFLDEIPMKEPHWKSPRFRISKSTNEPAVTPGSRNIITSRLELGLVPPNRSRHQFFVEPSALTVDVDIDSLHKNTDLTAAQWFEAFRSEFPQFTYIYDYKKTENAGCSGSGSGSGSLNGLNTNPSSSVSTSSAPLFDTKTFLDRLWKKNLEKKQEKADAMAEKRRQLKEVKDQQKQLKQQQRKEEKKQKELLGIKRRKLFQPMSISSLVPEIKMDKEKEETKGDKIKKPANKKKKKQRRSKTQVPILVHEEPKEEVTIMNDQDNDDYDEVVDKKELKATLLERQQRQSAPVRPSSTVDEFFITAATNLSIQPSALSPPTNLNNLSSNSNPNSNPNPKSNPVITSDSNNNNVPTNVNTNHTANNNTIPSGNNTKPSAGRLNRQQWETFRRLLGT